MTNYTSTCKLKELLLQFLLELNNADINYAIVGNFHELPDKTENDVDIWVSHISRARLILDKCAKNVGLRIYMRNITANGSNNYYYDESSKEVRIVKIDLMKETAYKSIFPIIQANQYENCTTKWGNFNVAKPELEAVVHLLYPLLMFNIVKSKYKDHLHSMAHNCDFLSLLNNAVGSKVANDLQNALANTEWHTIEEMGKAVRFALIKQALAHSMAAVFINIATSLWGAINRLVSKNGCVVAFTGIDGAGKSTMDKYMADASDIFFPKGKFGHQYWRPFLLPKLSAALKVKSSDGTFDNSGRRIVKSGILNKTKDFIKYIYYVTDFVVGSLKYIKITHTGGLVVFDRYHFDNIVYPERFGFSVSKRLMRFIDRYIIPQPDVLFYFYADTQVLYERKREIDIDVIDQQKKVYDVEIQQHGSVVKVDTNCTMEISFETVMRTILNKMASRYK